MQETRFTVIYALWLDCYWFYLKRM